MRLGVGLQGLGDYSRRESRGAIVWESGGLYDYVERFGSLVLFFLGLGSK